MYCDAAGKLSTRCYLCLGLVRRDVSVEEAADVLLHRRIVGPPKAAVFCNRLLNTIIVFYLGIGVLAANIDTTLLSLWTSDPQLTSYVGATWLKNIIYSYVLFAQPPHLTDFVVPLAIMVDALGYKLLFISRYMSRSGDRCLCPEHLLC